MRENTNLFYKIRKEVEMANLDITKYGITGAAEIIHNPSYEFLFEEEMKEDLTGFDKG